MDANSMTKAQLITLCEKKDKEIEKWKTAFEDQKKVTALKERDLISIKSEQHNVINKIAKEYEDKIQKYQNEYFKLERTAEALLNQNKRITRGLLGFNNMIEKSKSIITLQNESINDMISVIQEEYLVADTDNGGKE